MERQELEEIVNKESDEIVKRCKRQGNIKLSFKEAFKIIYKDLNLHQYRHYAPPEQISIKYLLPFFEQIVVPYRALNEASFKKVFDMEIEDLVELIKKNRVVLNLVDSYTHYSNLDFFDPVLELMPPSNVRGFWLYGLILGGKDGIDRVMEKTERLWELDIKPNTPWKNGVMKNAFQRTYLEMTSIEEEEILDELVRNKNFIGLYTGASLISGPIFNGLNGIPNYEREHIDYYVKTSGLNLPADNIFPTEIGKILTKEYKLYFPIKANVNDLERLYVDSVMESARDLLYDFYNEITSENESITLKEDELLRIFTDARGLMQNIVPTTKKYNKWIGAGMTIGTFGLTSIITNPAVGVGGVLASLGYTIKGDKISEKIAKWRLGQLPCSIWTFEKNLSGIKKLTLQ